MKVPGALCAPGTFIMKNGKLMKLPAVRFQDLRARSDRQSGSVGCHKWRWTTG
jgi:hypothetical protein